MPVQAVLDADRCARSCLPTSPPRAINRSSLQFETSAQPVLSSPITFYRVSCSASTTPWRLPQFLLGRSTTTISPRGNRLTLPRPPFLLYHPILSQISTHRGPTTKTPSLHLVRTNSSLIFQRTCVLLSLPIVCLEKLHRTGKGWVVIITRVSP